jgi:hypothetical protein
MNFASEHKHALRASHYAVQSRTERPGHGQQYDYQLYPKRLKELLRKTRPGELKIIPIGDPEEDGDFWVIPFALLQQWLVPKHLTKDSIRGGKRCARRWRFHIERRDKHLFVLYPGNRVRLEVADVRKYYGAPLPPLTNARIKK